MDLNSSSISYQTNMLLGHLIQEVNHKMNTGLDGEKVLNFIFDSLEMVIPYDRIGIALLESDAKEVRLKWFRSKGPTEGLVLGYCAPIQGSSLEKILETGEPRTINDLRIYFANHPQSESTRLALKDGLLSSLTCPLQANGKPMGFVFFSSFKPYTYQDEHVQTFLAIADELSVVIEQMRLRDYYSEGSARERSFSRAVHDLRAPLSIIKGYLDLATEEDWYPSLPSGAQEVYSVLDRTTKDMLILLEELTELRNIKNLRQPLNMGMVPLKEFCGDITSAGQLFGKKKEISFVTHLDSQLPENAIFDRVRIRRVLENLVTNAIKFSHRGKKVSFSVKSDGGQLHFSITDQGQGIRSEEISKLFTEFGKTSTIATEDESSTGLGLAISKEIVERHGGQISVDSHYGRGSTFSFWIPVTPLSKESLQ